MWDKTIFLKNIDTLVSDKCNGVARVFNEKIKDRDAVTKWKTTDNRPSVSTLLKIIEEFKVTLDWLLTGEGAKYRGATAAPEHCPPDCPFAQCKEEVFDMCVDVKEILESGNAVAATALQSNILAFKDYVKKNEKVAELERRIAQIEKIATLNHATDTG